MNWKFSESLQIRSHSTEDKPEQRFATVLCASITSQVQQHLLYYLLLYPILLLLTSADSSCRDQKNQLCTKGTLLKAALDISDRPCTCVVITIFYYNTSLHLCCNLLYFFLFSLMVLEAPQNFLFLLCWEGWPKATEYVYMAEHIIWIPKRSTARSTQSWWRPPFWLAILLWGHTHEPSLAHKEYKAYSMPNVPSEQQGIAQWIHNATDSGRKIPACFLSVNKMVEHCNTEK